MPINPGRMNQRLTFLRPVVTLGSGGERRVTYTPSFILYGEVSTLSGQAEWRAMQMENPIVLTVQVRYHGDLAREGRSMHVLYDGREYAIYDVKDPDREARRYLLLKLQRYGWR